MKVLIFSAFVTGVILILFVKDYDKLQERAIEMEITNMNKLQEMLKVCKQNQKDCRFEEKKIEMLENKKPFITSLFLIWLTDNFNTFINNLGIQNIIILILILYSVKIIIFN
jgi:hypothetical protein